MAKVRLWVLTTRIFLILPVLLCSKCDAVEYFNGELEKFNGIVQGGLLKHISKGIMTEDNGNMLDCVEDLKKFLESLQSYEMWALKSKKPLTSFLIFLKVYNSIDKSD